MQHREKLVGPRLGVGDGRGIESAAIRERREPNASVAQVLPCYRTLHELDKQLQAQEQL